MPTRFSLLMTFLAFWLVGAVRVDAASPIIANTLDATNVGAFGATFAGLANPNHAASVAAYFEYGPTFTDSTNYGSLTTTQTLISGGNDIYVTFRVSNLIDLRRYAYRLVVITNSTPVYGSARAFMTGGGMPAEIQVLDATNITGTTALLRAWVTPNTIGSFFIAYFQWGTSTDYGQQIGNFGGSGMSPILDELPVIDLAPGTLYHFRVKTYRVQDGATVYSDDRTFTTLHIPTVATGSANVSSNMATLNGSVNPNNAAANVFFEWGATSAYGNTTSAQVLPAGNNPVSVSATIGPLPIDEYHFRMVATTVDGSAAGADQSFTVSNPGAIILSACSDADFRLALLTNRTVRFVSDCFINLTNSITIQSETIVDATGHAVTISGGNSNRIFYVRPGASLTLLGLRLANGGVQGTNGSDGRPGFPSVPGQPGQSVEAGGILLSNASLYAANCLFTNCSAAGGWGGSTPEGSGVFVGAAGNASGGVISAHGASITLSNCVVVGNSAVAGFSGFGGASFSPERRLGNGVGGAIALEQGDLTLIGCNLAGNAANVSGGALYNNGASIHVSGTTFRANSANPGGFGGAFAQVAGTLNVADSLFSSNAAYGLPGYGINFGTPGGRALGGAAAITGGDALIQRCTLRNNSAVGGANGPPNSINPGNSGEGRGGALYSEATVFITNSTFAHNFAAPGPAIYPRSDSSIGRGGAIAVAGGTLNMLFSTVASNSVHSGSNHVNASIGGGLDVTAGVLRLGDSLLAGNMANGSPSNAFGDVADLWHNISSDGTPALTLGVSRNNTDPLLLPLADNGGPTLTMALRAGSPALHTADCVPAPATDQRGYPRPNGPGCDIGAYEGPGTTELRIIQRSGSPDVLRWMAEAGQPYRLDTSSDLVTWTPVATNTAAVSGWIDFPVPGNPSPCFFRLLAQ